MSAPVLVKPIPAQVINERAAYGPFDLKAFIQTPDNAPMRFSAELKAGGGLPKGMICTSDGFLTGIPAKDTQGNYEVIIHAENEAGALQADLVMTIKQALTESSSGTYVDKLKAQVWQAMEQHLPIPDIGELYNLPITELDIYYLIERWGFLIIWNASDLTPPGEKHLLTVEGVSQHYNIYDRGSCLVAAPKDLFSHERTLVDSLQTSVAMAREVYKRNWIIELAGFEKMARAAWVELQHLGDQHGKRVEIMNYEATVQDVRLYSEQAYVAKILKSGME